MHNSDPITPCRNAGMAPPLCILPAGRRDADRGAGGGVEGEQQEAAVV